MNRSIGQTVQGIVSMMCFCTAMSCAAASVRAADLPPMGEAEKERIRLVVKEVLREYAASLNEKQGPGAADGVVRDIRQTNTKFMRSHGPAYFKPFLEGQHPRATVVTCSDSRVHSHALDATPDNDLFVIRNIGNQLATAEGSVEYGVHHLRTPLLLFVGHSACGAVKAASADYSQEPAAIRRELDTLQIPLGDAGLNSIRLNVNNQVRRAMSKFEAEVLSGHLSVVGAIYDFRNEMKLGQGRLNIINVNGETDPAKISRMAMMQAAPSRTPPRHKPAARDMAGETQEKPAGKTKPEH